MKVLVIGGSGYIGSALTRYLNVDSIDIQWFGGPTPTYCVDYKNLDSTFYQQYTHIVLLAGHSSVLMCQDNFSSSWQNNVTNFSNLISKLSKHHVLIYASSGSVYGNGGLNRCENMSLESTFGEYDLTKQMIEIIAKGARCKTIGLRFGTLSGYAKFARKDLLLNALTVSAKENKCITVFNGNNHRSILGISDCVRAIKTIIENHEVINSQHTIYNLASFSGNILSFAEKAKDILQVPLYVTDETINNFSFELNVDRFKTDFNFNFQDTITSLLVNLSEKYQEISWSDRKQKVKYV